jgi:hypothetical protein
MRTPIFSAAVPAEMRELSTAWQTVPEPGCPRAYPMPGLALDSCRGRGGTYARVTREDGDLVSKPAGDYRRETYL